MNLLRRFTFSALLLLCLGLAASAAQPKVRGGNVMPPALRPGDRIAILEPAYSLDSLKIAQAAGLIKSWGFEPVIGENVGGSWNGCYSGTPQERAADLNRALEDDSIKAILCTRGGYGAIHLLPLVDMSLLKAHPKWIIGYSDITTLHSMAVCSGVMSLHGVMCGSLASGEGRDISTQLMREIITGAALPQYVIPAHPCNIEGEARGTLVGGNICTFDPLYGSGQDFLEGDDLILFIEEVGEHLHRLDRLFNSLMLRGVLGRCRGVILGDFEDCPPKDEDPAEGDVMAASVEELYSKYLQPLGIPLCCGLHSGHGDDNFPLIMGAPVLLQVSAEGSRITFCPKQDSPRHIFYTD